MAVRIVFDRFCFQYFIMYDSDLWKCEGMKRFSDDFDNFDNI